MKIPAYIDSSAGLLPCHATSLDAAGRKVTIAIRAGSRAARYGFKSGESWHVLQIVPRDKVTGRRSMRGARILPYSWRETFAAESR